MTDVDGLDILFAWLEFAILVGAGIAFLLHRSGRDQRIPTDKAAAVGFVATQTAKDEAQPLLAEQRPDDDQ
jgi:hypothetical protein